MNQILDDLQKNKPKIVTDIFIDSSHLAPQGFFSKTMNISKESLCNVFILWKEAIVSFLNDNYVDHDALVGENACHIRTCALIDIALIKNSNLQFNASLHTIAAQLKQIINSFKFITISGEDINKSVHAFLIKNNLTLSIPSQFFNYIKYILDTYLLTLTKETLQTSGITLYEKTSYQTIRNLGFAYNRAQFLVHHTQKSLSASSCEYVQSEARLLNNHPLSLLLKIKKDAHGRSFLPQFLVAKVLFLRALAQNRPLIVPITRYFNKLPFDHITLCFKPNANKTNYSLNITPSEHFPCMIMSGVVNYDSFPESMHEYKKRLLSYSFLDLIFANFAIHPQYAGDLKELPPPFDESIETLRKNTVDVVHNNEKSCISMEATIKSILAEKNEFERLRQLAVKNGCSFDNPSLFFINHMYCDNASNHISNEISPRLLRGSLSQYSFKSKNNYQFL